MMGQIPRWDLSAKIRNKEAKIGAGTYVFPSSLDFIKIAGTDSVCGSNITLRSYNKFVSVSHMKSPALFPRSVSFLFFLSTHML